MASPQPHGLQTTQQAVINSSGQTSQPNYGFLIIGSPGAGKSSTGNTILGLRKSDPKAFKTGCSFQSITDVTSSEKTKCCLGNDVTATFTVVDTPNLKKDNSDETLQDWNAKTDIEGHKFIVIYVIRCNTIYTPEDKKTYQKLKNLLPDRLKRRIIIGFTFFDEMDTEKDIRDILLQPSTLSEVLSDADGRYVIFSNKADDEDKRKQIQALVDAVNFLEGNMIVKVGLLGDSEDTMAKVKEHVEQNLKSVGFLPEISRKITSHHVFLYVIEENIFKEKTKLELLQKINKENYLEVQRHCIIVFAVEQPMNNEELEKATEAVEGHMKNELEMATEAVEEHMNDELERVIEANEVPKQFVIKHSNRYVQIVYNNVGKGSRRRDDSGRVRKQHGGHQDVNGQTISGMVRTLVKENHFSQCSFPDTIKAQSKEVPNKDSSSSRQKFFSINLKKPSCKQS